MGMACYKKSVTVVAKDKVIRGQEKNYGKKGGFKGGQRKFTRDRNGVVETQRGPLGVREGCGGQEG